MSASMTPWVAKGVTSEASPDAADSHAASMDGVERGSRRGPTDFERQRVDEARVRRRHQNRTTTYFDRQRRCVASPRAVPVVDEDP